MTGAARPLVYLIAGEPSGDVLGGGLMTALSARLGGTVDYAGVGGAAMAAAGLTSLFPMEDLSVMGAAEVLPRLPKLLSRMGETRADILARRPDVLVTIDSPDFCFRVAKGIHQRLPGLPIVHYVAPTVWAWRPGRAKAVARFLDHLLCLFPFEPPYFEREGLAATFVGHPIAQRAPHGDGAAFRARHGLAPDEPLLLVLPGSRQGELDRLLPVFGETLECLRSEGWQGRVVIPTLPRLAPRVRSAAASWRGGAVIVADDADKQGAFAAATAALAASGTVLLELAAAGVPAVVAYRLSGLSAAIARRLLKVRHVGLVNILLETEVMPEFLQQDCRADKLAAAVGGLLRDGAARERQKARFQEAMALLRGPADAPADAAAGVIAEIVGRGART